jgi:deglycase
LNFGTIKDDLTHAGAEWVDQEVMVDGNLITRRKPDDQPAFKRAVITALTGLYENRTRHHLGTHY